MARCGFFRLMAAGARMAGIATAFGWGKRLARDSAAERVAFEQLHHQERLVLRPADIEQRADVRMIQGRGGARFALEAVERFAIGCERGRQKSDGHLPSQTDVFRLVDDAHASLADRFQNAVMRDGLHDHVPLSVSLSPACPAARNGRLRILCPMDSDSTENVTALLDARVSHRPQHP